MKYPSNNKWKTFDGEFSSGSETFGWGKPIDSDAQLFFNQLTVQPSDQMKGNYNDLFYDLKESGNFSKIDRLYLFAAEQKQHALISLVNPTSTLPTEINSPTFTELQGFKGDGATKALLVNYTLGVDNVKFQRNDGGISVYSRGNYPESSAEAGIYVGSYFCAISSGYFAGTSFSGANSSAIEILPAVSYVGMKTAIRDGASSYKYYEDGSLTGQTTTASDALPPTIFTVLCVNFSGTLALFSTKEVSLFCIHSGSLDVVKFNSSIRKFMFNIGKAL